MSAGWTDERHAMYIRSLEASFVRDQLYKHLVPLNNAAEPGPSTPSPLKNDQLHNHGHDAKKKDPVTNGFKVLQGGVWRKVEFKRRSNACAQVRPKQRLPGSPWIQRFIPGGCSSGAGSGDRAETSVSDRESGTRTIPGSNPLCHGRGLGGRKGQDLLDEYAALPGVMEEGST